MNIFVSYTRRDGVLTLEKLKKISGYLSRKHNIFIHALESLEKDVNQNNVISKLIQSDVMILLFTEGCLLSPWVNLEIELSNLLGIPILSVDAEKLKYE